MDAHALDHPPAIIWEARKRRSHRQTNRRRTAALFVGAILILPDGTECRIIAFDQHGRPLCNPQRNTQGRED